MVDLRTWKKIEEETALLAKQMRASTDDLPNDRTSIKARVERATRDRIFFFETYLPLLFKYGFCGEHEHWNDLLDIEDEMLLTIAAFRGLGKSTFITIGDTIYDVMTGRQPFTVIVSETETQAENFTRAVKYFIENNPRLAKDFGGKKCKASGGDTDFVANGCKVLARGYMQPLRGLFFEEQASRPTCFKFDDMEDNKSAKNRRIVTEKIRKVVEEARRGVANDRPPKFCIVGNYIHKFCFIAHFLNPDKTPLWHHRRVGVFGPNGRSIWEEMFPTEKELGYKAEMELASPGSWYKEMMQDPREDMRSFHNFVMTTLEEQLPKISIWFGYDDAAAKGETTSDYQALLVCGWNGEQVVVLHAWIKQAEPDEAIDEMYRIEDEFGKHFAWRMEEVAFQSLFKHAFNIKKQEHKHPLRWMHRKGALPNKEARIKSIAPLVNRGDIIFCEDGGDMKELLEQLQWWPDDAHDDAPDALEGVVDFAQDLGAAIACAGFSINEHDVHSRDRITAGAFKTTGELPDPYDTFRSYGADAIGVK